MTRRNPEVLTVRLPGYVDVAINDLGKELDNARELAKRIYANAADPNATVADLENIPDWVKPDE